MRSSCAPLVGGQSAVSMLIALCTRSSPRSSAVSNSYRLSMYLQQRILQSRRLRHAGSSRPAILPTLTGKSVLQGCTGR